MHIFKHPSRNAMVVTVCLAASVSIVSDGYAASRPATNVKSKFVLPLKNGDIPIPTPRPVRYETGKPVNAKAMVPVEPQHAVGVISTVYVQALVAHLSGVKNAPKLFEVRQALKSAADEPLTIPMIKSVNRQLAENNAKLDLLIKHYPGGNGQLAEDIYRARGKTSA